MYIFNLCFIFDKNTNICSYEAIVKKLACDLRTLEVILISVFLLIRLLIM